MHPADWDNAYRAGQEGVFEAVMDAFDVPSGTIESTEQLISWIDEWARAQSNGRMRVLLDTVAAQSKIGHP